MGDANAAWAVRVTYSDGQTMWACNGVLRVGYWWCRGLFLRDEADEVAERMRAPDRRVTLVRITRVRYRKVKCHACQGTGRHTFQSFSNPKRTISDTCTHCRGTGRVRVREEG